MAQEKEDDFYQRLKEELIATTQWPSDYLYKFIVPTDEEKVKQIQDIFDNTGAVINSRKSKNGKYTSLSIMVNMDDADAVIDIYKKVGQIKGVISL